MTQHVDYAKKLGTLLADGTPGEDLAKNIRQFVDVLKLYTQKYKGPNEDEGYHAHIVKEAIAGFVDLSSKFRHNLNNEVFVTIRDLFTEGFFLKFESDARALMMADGPRVESILFDISNRFTGKQIDEIEKAIATLESVLPDLTTEVTAPNTPVPASTPTPFGRQGQGPTTQLLG